MFGKLLQKFLDSSLVFGKCVTVTTLLTPINKYFHKVKSTDNSFNIIGNNYHPSLKSGVYPFKTLDPTRTPLLPLWGLTTIKRCDYLRVMTLPLWQWYMIGREVAFLRCWFVAIICMHMWQCYYVYVIVCCTVCVRVCLCYAPCVYVLHAYALCLTMW